MFWRRRGISIFCSVIYPAGLEHTSKAVTLLHLTGFWNLNAWNEKNFQFLSLDETVKIKNTKALKSRFFNEISWSISPQNCKILFLRIIWKAEVIEEIVLLVWDHTRVLQLQNFISNGTHTSGTVKGCSPSVLKWIKLKEAGEGFTIPRFIFCTTSKAGEGTSCLGKVRCVFSLTYFFPCFWMWDLYS